MNKKTIILFLPILLLAMGIEGWYFKKELDSRYGALESAMNARDMEAREKENFNIKCDQLKEENRDLKNKITDLEKQIEQAKK